MNIKNKIEESFIGVLLFIVVLPISLALPLASGVPISAGVISSIIGLLLTILLSKNNVLIYGPNTTFCLIVLASISKFSNYSTFLLSLILSGIIQIILGLTKSLSNLNLIPKLVIKGVIISISILLIVKQLPYLLGYNFETKSINYFYLPICILLITVLLFQIKIRRFSSLHILFFLLLISILFPFVTKLIFLDFSTKDTLNVQLENFNLFGSVLNKSSFQNIIYKDVFINGITLAIISSLNSIINVKGIESIDVIESEFNINRVLILQGLGNIICGFLGGIPITVSFIRSSLLTIFKVNSKISFIISLILLVLGITFYSHLISQVPLIIPSIIFVYIGYNILFSKRNYLKFKAENYKTGIVLYSTIFGILKYDLLFGVLIGLIITLLLLIFDLLTLKKQKIKFTFLSIIQQYKKIWIVLLSGTLTIIINASNFFEFDRNFINNLNVFGAIFGVLVFLMWENNKKK